jgi:uncharacterized lipoprotein YbaY
MADRRVVVHLAPTAADEEVVTAASVVRLTLEDVSLLDEPSAVVAETSIPPGASEETFVVEASLDPRRRYAVRVHVDQQGNGLVQPGDLVGAAAVPQESTDRDEPLEVRVTPVIDAEV